MHAGLPRGAGAPAGSLALAAAGGLAVLTLFGGDGSAYGPLAAIGTLALALGGTALAAGLWGRLPVPRLTLVGILFAAFLTALVVWMGLSVLWSVAPDRSWSYFNRGLVYLAFLAVGLAAGTVRGTLRRAAAGAGVLSAAVVVWALAGKVIPDLFPDGERVARLRDPLGYWNALAVVAAFAILFGVWAASRREHRRVMRVAAAVVVFASTVALLLTYSRGGAVAATVVVAVFVVLIRERLQALATLAIAVPPALAIAIWAFSADGISANQQPYDERLEAGLILGALLVAGGALVALVTSYLIRHEAAHAGRIWRPTRRQSWGAAGAAAAIAVAAVLVASGGDPAGWASRAFDEFTNPALPQGSTPSRLGSLSSSSRWDWWRESWELFERDPVHGAGAGAFVVARRPVRQNLIVVVEPHNVPLQFLAETGLVGFALLVGALAAGIAAVVQAVRRTDGAERAAASALAAAALAYLLHALVDYDWDFVALTGPVLLVIGLLIATGLPALSRRRRPLLAAGAAVVAAVSIVSLAAPWLAGRKVLDAYEAIDRGDPAVARDDADEARALNPVAVEPLYAAAAAEEERRDDQEALELYVRAVELQPENSQTWYELARYEHALGLRDAAIRHVGRAAELDPRGQDVVILIREILDLEGP